MILTKDTVSFSRKTWEELRNDEYFRELIEIVEDREALIEAKNETDGFVDLDDYHASRTKQKNV